MHLKRNHTLSRILTLQQTHTNSKDKTNTPQCYMDIVLQFSPSTHKEVQSIGWTWFGLCPLLPIKAKKQTNPQCTNWCNVYSSFV